MGVKDQLRIVWKVDPSNTIQIWSFGVFLDPWPASWSSFRCHSGFLPRLSAVESQLVGCISSKVGAHKFHRSGSTNSPGW